jgi:4-amino-4-deoxy-L-arabinose transferase-like glycosyltransferase
LLIPQTILTRRWLLAILLLSVLLRVAVALTLGDAITETRGGTHDQISYDALAQRVATGHGFSFGADWWPGVAADQPTAFWSYLYTLFLAAIYIVFGHHPLAARLIQAVLAGVLMPLFTYRLARRVFYSPSPADDMSLRAPFAALAPAHTRRCSAGEQSLAHGGIASTQTTGLAMTVVAGAQPVAAGRGAQQERVCPFAAFRASSEPVEGGPGGEVAALIAAAASAVYLYFITYAASLMTEALYITAILWILDAALRLAEALDGAADARQRLRLGIELGLAMATALLLRQIIGVFLAVLALWFLWLAWRRGWLRRAVPVLLTSALTSALLISPFVVRNYRLFGVVGMPNTNVGINFFWANHPIYGTQFEAVLLPAHGISYQELIPPELRGLNDALLDRALLARGMQFVVDDPGRYLALCLSRIPIYFQFWPTPRSTFLSNAARLLSFGLCLPFMLYGLILSIRYARKEEALREANSFDPALRSGPSLRLPFLVLVWLFMAVYTAVHLASWANVRYRLPVDAFLILFAAYGVNDLSRRLSPIR